MRIFLIIFACFIVLTGCASGKFSVKGGKAKYSAPFEWTDAQEQELLKYGGMVHIGMSKEDLYNVFGEALEKGYRGKGNEEWITFSDWTTEEVGDIITFYLTDGKIKGWFKEEGIIEIEKE